MNDRGSLDSPQRRRWPETPRGEVAVVTAAMVLPTLLTWLYFVALREAPAGLQQGAYLLDKIVPLLLPVGWVLAVQRQWPRWQWPSARSWGAAAASGLLAATIIVAGYKGWAAPAGWLDEAGPVIQSKLAGFGIASPGGFFQLAAFLSCVNSLFEEYYWRWFVFGRLRRIVPLLAAGVLASAAFAAHHAIILGAYLGWFTPLMMACTAAVAVAGGFWCWCYHRSGSLIGPWLSHLLADAAIFAVGYELLRPLWNA